MNGKVEQIATKIQSKILKAWVPENSSTIQLASLCSGDCLARTCGTRRSGTCAIIQPAKLPVQLASTVLGNINILQSAGIWYYSLLDSSILVYTLIISPLSFVRMLCTSTVNLHYTTQGNFNFTDIFYKTKPNPTKLNNEVLEISELNSSISLSQLCKLSWTLIKW